MGIIQTTKQLRPRDKKDHYPTPIELCRAAIAVIPETAAARTILDPGSGAGVWGEAARKRWPDAYIMGVEMNEEQKPSLAYDKVLTMNYLHLPAWSIRPPCFDLIIGNPPYGRNADGSKDRNLAEKFVRLSYDELAPEGYIVFLLRLAFLEGQRRSKHFWPKYPLKDIYALSRRPSFTGNRKTDATAYGLFVWQKGYNGPTYLKRLIWDYEDNV